MKPIILIFVCVGLAACGRQNGAQPGAQERPPENGAQYKEREGVALTETMKKSIGLKTAEVEEAKVAPRFTIPLHVLSGPSGFQTIAFTPTSRTASGWLTAAQAALVKPGLSVEIEGPNGAGTGKVAMVEKSAFHVAGDYEVTVELAEPLDVGTRVQATFRAEAGEAAASIPQSALLKTAEGAFVYVVNGERYLRSPVKVGAESDPRVEIADGLYTGDEVVSEGVMALWLAELQVLRGGKACTCGH